MGSRVNQMTSSRTLELNPRHPIISKLNTALSEDGAEDEESHKDLAWLIHDTALTSSGFIQDDAESFAERMYRTIAGSWMSSLWSLNLKLKSQRKRKRLKMILAPKTQDRMSFKNTSYFFLKMIFCMTNGRILRPLPLPYS